MDLVLIIGFLVVLFVGILIGKFLLESRYRSRMEQWMAEAEERIRKDAISRSRLTLGGRLAEQMAPYFPDFKYDPTEVRFMGTPVDLLVFPGLSGNEPKEIVFVEVKTGQSKLTPRERKVKDLVEQKKVRWEEYRPDNAG